MLGNGGTGVLMYPKRMPGSRQYASFQRLGTDPTHMCFKLRCCMYRCICNLGTKLMDKEFLRRKRTCTPYRDIESVELSAAEWVRIPVLVD